MTCDYNFLADLLNKFLQLTPWVQVLLGFMMCFAIIYSLYFLKEAVAYICEAIVRRKHGFEVEK